MKTVSKLMGLFSDETRLRLLMVLAEKELCVCQLMGVLGVSQPLVSRNLALLSSAGLLEERREGKMVFYSMKKGLKGLPGRTIKVLREELRESGRFKSDLHSLRECGELQKKTGRCDMKTFREFMEKRKKMAGNGRRA